MSTKKAGRHLSHYLPLIGIFVVGTFAIVSFSYDRHFQTGVVIAMAGAYVTWGIMHHILHDDLSMQIVLEYVTIALLGLVVLLGVLV